MIQSELTDGLARIKADQFCVTGEVSDEGFESMEAYTLAYAPIKERSLVLAEIKQLQRDAWAIKYRAQTPTECYGILLCLIVACIAVLWGLL